MEILSQDQIDTYRSQGYLVLPAHLSARVVTEARAEIERLSEHAQSLVASDDLIDLEDSHTPENPRIRRIKRPDLQSEFFNDLMHSDQILGIARDLIGSNIRMHTTKLNMKKAAYGAPIQWHQDFAFYPHTNDDVLAIGIVFDDVGHENGPLQVIPGSHRGPIFDHHANGYFAGSVDLTTTGYSLGDAATLTGPAGTVSIHHARTLHGSALNTSDRDRQMLFYEMMAADAFPIMGAMTRFDDIDQYNSMMLCGAPSLEPRLTDIPIRIPQPQPPKAASIYEIQSQGVARDYQTLEEKESST